MPNHTPGPWTTFVRLGRIAIAGPDLRTIANVPYRNDASDQMPDARLIAASPEMEEALSNLHELAVELASIAETIRPLTKGQEATLKAAEKALAKAVA